MGNRVVADSQDEVILAWGGLKPSMTGVPIRRDTGTQTHWEKEGPVITEAQTGVTCLQVTEHQGLRATPEAWRKAQQLVLFTGS